MISKQLLVDSNILADRHQANPDSLSVLPRADRSPAVYSHDLDDELPVSLSISHRAGLVAAAVTQSPRFIGVDVELTDPRSQAMLLNYLTPEERHWMSGDPLLENVGWAAKEALYKATRGRHGAAPLETTVSALIGDGEDWGSLDVSCESFERPLSGSWRRLGRHVIVLLSSPAVFGDQPISSRSSLAGL